MDKASLKETKAQKQMREIMDRRDMRSGVRNNVLRDWFKDTTPINRIFGYYLCSATQCQQCDAKTNHTIERMITLILPINHEKIIDIQTGINRYTLCEKADDFYCDNCQTTGSTIKQLKLWNTPPLLIIRLSLDMFVHGISGKNTKFIRINETIDLSHILVYPPENRIFFDLSGMILHDGKSLTSGHYFTLSKNNNDWIMFNDEIVSPIASIDDYLSNRVGQWGTITPFLLLYTVRT